MILRFDSNQEISAVKYLVVFLVLTLAVLHHDLWWWDSKDTVFGFMPISLAWHMFISLAAGIVGWIAVTFCWPAELEEGPAREETDREEGGRA